jgi:hypothetical protein
MDSRLWPCTPCGEITEFVQPPCDDGHTGDGGECPEWACADCGAAVVMGGPALEAEVVRTRIAA